MTTLHNLVVDLGAHLDARPTGIPDGVLLERSAAIGERVLAWIDAEFGGFWSSEAYASSNTVVSRHGAPIGFASYAPQALHVRWLRGLAREPGVGVLGPLGVAAAERGKGVGGALVVAGLQALAQRGYTRALIPAVGDERLVRFYVRVAGACVAESFDRSALLAPRPRVLVMASGSGTNLQAVLDRSLDGSLPVDVVALVTNDPQARAIERARAAGVASIRVVRWMRTQETRQGYDARLLAAVREEEPELVLLLGWMHLLAEPFVRAFPALLNVHPAFLPLDPSRDCVGLPDGAVTAAFRGPRAVRDALAASSRWVGATVHGVTADTDRGPVYARRPLEVTAGENEADVVHRLHPLEHRVVASAVLRWLFERA